MNVDMTHADACTMAIVLVASDGSATARAIDATTGGLGWTHVYLDPCRTDTSGRPVAIGYTLASGVHWMDPRIYKSNRKQARIDLDPRTGAEIFGCVRARLGKPFSVLDLIRGARSNATCVGLVVGCMPWELQRKLAAVQVGPCVSPNTISTFFGVGPA